MKQMNNIYILLYKMEYGYKHFLSYRHVSTKTIVANRLRIWYTSAEEDA